MYLFWRARDSCTFHHFLGHLGVLGHLIKLTKLKIRIFFAKKNSILQTFLKANMKKQEPRDRYSCLNDMNRSVLEREGLGACFEGYYSFVKHFVNAVSWFETSQMYIFRKKLSRVSFYLFCFFL